MPAEHRIRPLCPQDAPACDAIIASLPYHFGDEGGVADCAAAVRAESGYAAEMDGAVAGFLTWRPWFGTSLEITWMAVHADRRRAGIGRSLIETLVAGAPPDTRHLVVTTLSSSTPEDEGADTYEGTRRFYRENGFDPVWEPHGWWNDENQAVLMVRTLHATRPQRRVIEVPGLDPGVPYDYAAVAGDLVFTAGACPLDEGGAVIAPDDVAVQARVTAENLFACLAAAGADPGRVVKTTVYVASSDRADLVAAWDVIAAAFAPHRPPSTLLGVATLGYPGQLVEIEAIAARAPA